MFYWDGDKTCPHTWPESEAGGALPCLPLQAPLLPLLLSTQGCFSYTCALHHLLLSPARPDCQTVSVALSLDTKLLEDLGFLPWLFLDPQNSAQGGLE